MTVIHVTEETCSIGQAGAACGGWPGLLHGLRFALGVLIVALRLASFVVRRLLAGRVPALWTQVVPSQSGAAGGGAMCWADPGGPLGPVDLDVGAECNELPIAALVRLWRLRADRAAPVLAVVVERWLAAGWTMRLGRAVR